MSGQLLNLTTRPVSLSFTTSPSNLVIAQSGADALDVLGTPGNEYSFSLRCFLASASGTPSVSVSLETSMYNDDDSGEWVTLVTFNSITASNTTKAGGVTTGMLRYIRWRVTVTADTTFIDRCTQNLQRIDRVR